MPESGAVSAAAETLYNDIWIANMGRIESLSLIESALDAAIRTGELQEAAKHADCCVVREEQLDAARAEQRERGAKIADDIGRQYGEKDESRTRYPLAATCGAVACAVNIVAAIRADQ